MIRPIHWNYYWPTSAPRDLRHRQHSLGIDKPGIRRPKTGSRLLYTLVKGNGGSYEYFVCTGRHTGRTGCDLPYVPLYKIEAAVAKLWHSEQAVWEADGMSRSSTDSSNNLRLLR